ncbi:MAG: hypothetical protein ABIJ00_03805, partial [Candidatus Eisenbacteria bacterium]
FLLDLLPLPVYPSSQGVSFLPAYSRVFWLQEGYASSLSRPQLSVIPPARNRKIVEMGLIKVAQAIAEGKVKPTITDLDRLIRLEEFLRQEGEEKQQKFVFVWSDTDSSGKEVAKAGDKDNASTTPTGEKD